MNWKLIDGKHVTKTRWFLFRITDTGDYDNCLLVVSLNNGAENLISEYSGSIDMCKAFAEGFIDGHEKPGLCQGD